MAGNCGCSANSARTLTSTPSNYVGTPGRWYTGGWSETTARSTVARPTPKSRATCRFGTPSATSRLINAQSSTVITDPVCPGGVVFDRSYGPIFERRR